MPPVVAVKENMGRDNQLATAADVFEELTSSTADLATALTAFTKESTQHAR